MKVEVARQTGQRCPQLVRHRRDEASAFGLAGPQDRQLPLPLAIVSVTSANATAACRASRGRQPLLEDAGAEWLAEAEPKRHLARGLDRQAGIDQLRGGGRSGGSGRWLLGRRRPPRRNATAIGAAAAAARSGRRPWRGPIEPGAEGDGLGRVIVAARSRGGHAGRARAIRDDGRVAGGPDRARQQVEELGEPGLGGGVVGQDVEGPGEERRFLGGGLVLGAARLRPSLAERRWGVQAPARRWAGARGSGVRSWWCISVERPGAG